MPRILAKLITLLHGRRFSVAASAQKPKAESEERRNLCLDCSDPLRRKWDRFDTQFRRNRVGITGQAVDQLSPNRPEECARQIGQLWRVKALRINGDNGNMVG